MGANIVFPDRPRIITDGRPSFEALDLAETMWRTARGFLRKDEGAAASESMWVAECLNPMGDVCGRLLRLRDRISGSSVSEQYDLAEDPIGRPQ
jgi:hypothetical protein